jgi:putative lipase involved disintegration of autophagic bodies
MEVDQELGLPMPQIFEAMRYYFAVRETPPTANITITGHSLGGGLDCSI